jgi:hypothetical protein
MENTNGGEASTTRHDHQQYIYEPLHFRDREIRLLNISAGAKPSCTIEHFLLRSAPYYKAVSYRWGTGPSSKVIWMNGYPVKVSDNLFDFLSQRQSIVETSTLEEKRNIISDHPNTGDIREAQWARNPWLWIDQLCIDQSSVGEKNHQVALMGAIYSDALQVLVWLGKGIDGTEKAVRFAADCANVRVSRRNRQASEMLQLRAFQKIVSNQYWTRLWIIQEFVLARTVVLMSGAGQLSGTDFRELARDVAQLDESPAISRIWPFMKARRRITAAYAPGVRDLPHYTWQDLMRLSKKAECRDARDRVYGMLSMVKRQVRIKVDYTASAQDIRERIIEVEFMDCFDRPFSQKTWEEVGDADFERFLVDLDEALRLREPDQIEQFHDEDLSHIPPLQDLYWPKIDPEGPRRGIITWRSSTIARNVANLTIRHSK